MSVSSDSNGGQSSDPPLWSMGLAVLVILAAPLILYSLAPSGPLRIGDTVFSQGQQQVRVDASGTAIGHQIRETCLLDPNTPLIILQLQDGQEEDELLTTVQGNPVSEWPFCPPHTQVHISTRQIFQKPDPWDVPKRGLSWIVGG
ncbi:hypothetical protein [Nitrospira lenta]|uniref:Uncharacterized protein n=1 Tax=Nitrospira lenta TaxID=1436998 RepID=A0A330L4N7_9BACT|nr:hypothetical protein [Nitrospira lenta]SPP63882.1 conserved hypothetical protein [Nitrospira lenta]